MDFDDFAVQLSRYGLTKFGVFLGPYRGVVTRNDDPQRRGRIQAIIPAVQQKALDVWIDPMTRFAGRQLGDFSPPVVGASCWVEFENGNPSKPLRYQGGWYGAEASGDMPPEFNPQATTNIPFKSGFVTRSGHAFLFDDEPDKEAVRVLWHKPAPGDPAIDDPTRAADRESGDQSFISFEPDGSVQLVNADGASVTLDRKNDQILILDKRGNLICLKASGIQLVQAGGRVIELGAAGTTLIDPNQVQVVAPLIGLQGGGVFLGSEANQPIAKGRDLLAYIAGHTHSTAVGVSGPPTVPPDPSILSQKVKTG
jgi:hypothetical protein